MKNYRTPGRAPIPPGRRSPPREKPRDYIEWTWLVRRGKASPGEERVIGRRLRQPREEAGLTQRELAERLGITQQAVSRTERWPASPRWSRGREWCEACGAGLALDLASARARKP